MLEDRLGEREKAGLGNWIVGEKYSIADLNAFCWANWAELADVSLETFPRLERWRSVICERPVMKKGLYAPEKWVPIRERLESEEGAEEYAKGFSGCVMQGQESDQERLA